MHHPNTVRIDRYESNAEWYCLELTVTNVALNSCDLNAALNVLSWLSQEGTGVKTDTSFINKHVLNLSWLMSGGWEALMWKWAQPPETPRCGFAKLKSLKSEIKCLLPFFSSSQYPFGENMETSLLQPLEASLQNTTNTYCGRVSHLFTKKLKQSILSVQQDATHRWSGQHSNIIPWLLSD